MITQVLHCPYCQGTDIVKHGTTPEGKQRYRCRACPERGRTFLLEYTYAGQSPTVKQQIVDMAMNARRIGVPQRLFPHAPPLRPRPPLGDRGPRALRRCWAPGAGMQRKFALDASRPATVPPHARTHGCGAKFFRCNARS
jgi:hypothetical protein